MISEQEREIGDAVCDLVTNIVDIGKDKEKSKEMVKQVLEIGKTLLRDIGSEIPLTKRSSGEDEYAFELAWSMYDKK